MTSGPTQFRQVSALAEHAVTSQTRRYIRILSDFSRFHVLVDLEKVEKGGRSVVREQRIDSEEELFRLARKAVSDGQSHDWRPAHSYEQRQAPDLDFSVKHCGQVFAPRDGFLAGGGAGAAAGRRPGWAGGKPFCRRRLLMRASACLPRARGLRSPRPGFGTWLKGGCPCLRRRAETSRMIFTSSTQGAHSFMGA